ncbi:MAG: pyrroloquinoline quinone biosynthesis protein PqqB [Candidatus Thiodiazotropha sp. (ex Lucinoma kastoroae)]|nr:pyrroloquinoline quinone biosynthesis protein PqqB [Candidatus Thiodiazotropha sp. (ex Lucinoma kastoroae)]MCU7861132.1 pyrroloquinoline quinone biosynthesis protein PqqB [Candidatus Thiodiazotropha sp. (ex Lucinoma kastoroae)]
MLKVRVLGSGAGGGFPQWNCNCDNCTGVRSGSLNAKSRTQSSIAISSDGEEWLLVNASPDIRQQIIDFPALQPARSKRDTGIRAVLLIDSQIDHSTGLILLRENSRPLEVYCTRMVHQDLTTGFPVLNMLEHYCGVVWNEIPINGTSFEIAGIDGLVFTALALTSKAPPYSPHREDPHPGDNIGIHVQDKTTGRSMFYAPGLACIEPHLEPAMHASDLLLVDGTCWTDDEMERRGVGTRRSLAMGHLPQSGTGGMIEALKPFQRQRKVLIHINNTNPMLVEDSPERAELSGVGIEVSRDGMAIEV